MGDEEGVAQSQYGSGEGLHDEHYVANYEEEVEDGGEVVCLGLADPIGSNGHSQGDEFYDCEDEHVGVVVAVWVEEYLKCDLDSK